MAKVAGWALFVIGGWMLVSPQSITGLSELRWMYKYAFPGEVLLGIAVLVVAYYLIGMAPVKKPQKASH